MTDTEIIEWIEKYVVEINEEGSGNFIIIWLDDRGVSRIEEGSGLRTCVRVAANRDINTLPGNITLRTLGNIVRGAYGTCGRMKNDN